MNEKEFARFVSYVATNLDTGCEEWYGKVCHRGYGRFWYRGQWRQAHRIRWAWITPDWKLRETEQEFDPIKFFLDHICENRPCVCYAHLTPCTHKENHEARAQRYWERKRKQLQEEAI